MGSPACPVVHANAGVFVCGDREEDPNSLSRQRADNSLDRELGHQDPLLFVSKGYDPGDKELEFSSSSSSSCSSLVHRHASRSSIKRGKGSWSRHQKRAWHRLLSGFSRHKSERLRFLTITSVPFMKRDISAGFHAFKLRVRRLTPLKLVEAGYIEEKNLHYRYPGMKLTDPLQFEYVRVKTPEGPNGVLHILFYGSYLPQEWISEVWEEIVGAVVVWIEEVRSKRGVANYFVSQYLVEQIAFYLSWSWGWVFRGFCGVWRYLKRVHEAYGLSWGELLCLWGWVVRGGLSPPYKGVEFWLKVYSLFGV